MEDDTKPLDLSEIFTNAPWANPVNREFLQSMYNGEGLHEFFDKDPEIKPRVPEPVLVRALLVASVGLVGAFVGHSLDLTWIDPAIALYAISGPFIVGLWARRHVSPVPK